MTKRDEAILDTLTKRIRVLSLAQVAGAWWGGAKRGDVQAKARLRELERQSLVQLIHVLARPIPTLEAPVITWSAGEAEPNFGAVSYRLRVRWNLPVRRVLAVIATEQAGHRFAGSGGRVPRASEATHDLCLAAIYLRLRTAEPRRAKAWVSEATLYERGVGRNSRLPDAAIATRGKITVIEFGGAYPAAKVADFHGFCAERDWGYELW